MRIFIRWFIPLKMFRGGCGGAFLGGKTREIMEAEFHHHPIRALRIPAILFFLFLGAIAHAQVSQSADYAITASTLDSGGNRSASADYTLDGNVGSIAGISSTGSSAETDRSGYIAQLYDVSALVVSTSVPSVDEGLDFQLSASQQLDDGTFLALDPGAVSWSVLNGPISNVSAAGVATSGTVNQSTVATVQGSYSGSAGTVGLTVIPLVIDLQGTQQTVATGQPFTLAISPVSGEGPFTYQWMKNGTNIQGATDSTYSIANATSNDAGNYTVEVSNALGGYTTGVFDLMVTQGVAAAGKWTLGILGLLLFAVAARSLKNPKRLKMQGQE
ncbi:MAG: immunoglobulin domain-containing protein [Chthoniobacteraceae bacterium]